jgi:hypothetical protein
VRSADPAPGVAVEILVKEKMVAELRIVAVERRAAEDRPVAEFVALKDAAQAARQFDCDLAQMEQPAGAGWAFDLEIVAVIAVEALQRLDLVGTLGA